jgi:hypothetical protein
MDREYKGKFKFQTHLETEQMPVSQSCRVTVEKFSPDSIRVEFDSEDHDTAPMVFIDIASDGVPQIQIHCGVDDEQVRVRLIDGKWILSSK